MLSSAPLLPPTPQEFLSLVGEFAHDLTGRLDAFHPIHRLSRPTGA